MVCRTAVVLAALLLGMLPAKANAESPSYRLRTLPAGQVLRVRTEQRVYQIEILDGKTGEALVAGSLDGKEFGPAERMFIIGCTRGRQSDDGGFTLVLMGEIQEGMRIEWGRGSLDEADRGTTTPVKSIELVPLSQTAMR